MIPPKYLMTSSEGRSFKRSMLSKKSSHDMDDTIFNSVHGSDAFTSVAFDGDTSIDSNDDENRLLENIDDNDCLLFVDGEDGHSEADDDDVNSFGSQTYEEEANTDDGDDIDGDIEDPEQPAVTDEASVISEYLPDQQDSQHSRSSNNTQCSTSTRTHFVQRRRRSEYAARRCKSVDIMTERYMIHADEFNYYADYQKDEEYKKRRRTMICRAVCVLLSISGFIFALENAQVIGPKPSSQLPSEAAGASVTAAVAAEQTEEPLEFFEGDGNAYNEDAVTIQIQDTDNNPTSTTFHRNSNLVEVPFANHHNLRYDGLLFVKDPPSSTSSSTRTTPSYNSGNSNNDENEQLPHYSFDSYAKTLDPVTEFHFSPGESTTSKHVVLTNTEPSLFNNNGLNQHPQKEMANDPGLVLSIGLEPNGQLWLPRETGQNVLQYEVNDNHHYSKNDNKNHHHHHSTPESQDVGYTKKIYGPGDRFVLKITEDAISLFRNDYRELIGMWMNPKATEEKSIFTPKSFSPHGMYAQVWFKEPNSSMKVNGFQEVYGKNGYR